MDSILYKIEKLLVEETFKDTKIMNTILRKVKGWEFQYFKNRASEFYYILGKPNKYYSYEVKIEIPYFDDLYDGKQVTANVSHYDGDDLVSNEQSIIYNWKGLETVLTRNKKVADKMYAKGKMKESIDEGTVRYVSPRDLPDWVQRILKGKKIGKDVAVEIGDRVVTSGNWHDANVMDVYLYDKGKVAHQMAIGGQSPWDTGKEAQIKKGFETRLNKDKMILITNTYPKTAKLYVHPDAMIKALDEPGQQLTPEEYMVLAITRGLKAAYGGGYPRKEASAEYGIDYETVKAQLISKGMLNRAGAINKNGKNALASEFGDAFMTYDRIAKKYGIKSKRWG